MAIDIRDEGKQFSGYVGAEVRAEAARQNLSVAALARHMDIDRSTLNRYLTGARAFPVDTLYEAAEVLDQDPGWIVTTAYERYLKEHPEVDYREHGVRRLHPHLSVVDGIITELPADAAAKTPGYSPSREEGDD